MSNHRSKLENRHGQNDASCIPELIEKIWETKNRILGDRKGLDLREKADKADLVA